MFIYLLVFMVIYFTWFYTFTKKSDFLMGIAIQFLGKTPGRKYQLVFCIKMLSEIKLFSLNEKKKKQTNNDKDENRNHEKKKKQKQKKTKN